MQTRNSTEMHARAMRQVERHEESV